MIYHDPSKGPAPLVIRIDAFDRAAPVLNRLGDALGALAAALDPKRRVLDELVPLVRTAAALDDGYRSLPRRIQIPPPSHGFEMDRMVHRFLPPRIGDPVGHMRSAWDLMSAGEARERFGGFRHEHYVQQVEPLPTSIRCPACGRESHNPNDVRLRYCGACHAFHDELLDRMDLGGSP